MEENIDIAQKIIEKWDLNSSTYVKFTYLFQENRKEAKEFIRSVKDLRRAMHFFLSQNSISKSSKLVLAQNLMQIAMKRLEKEFYQILTDNRDRLDPESISNRSSRASGRSSTSDCEEEVGSDDEVEMAGKSISEVERVSALAMSDLKLIADCMISSGYGKECVKIYKIIRKSIVDEGLYRLGIERFSSSHFNKMNIELLDQKCKNWLNASKIAVKTLFAAERILCDHVFSASEPVRESCFTDITREGAIKLFKFPELVAKSKKTTDKMFCLIELYEALSHLWPETESIFNYESTTSVQAQAQSSLLKLREAVRAVISEFESKIQKDSSKSPIPRGGIHYLTELVTDYISHLADYRMALSNIVADWPLPVHRPLPESYFDSPTTGDGPSSPVAVRLAWLMLVLLCKLDSKAELYKDISLSYLFLANNLHFLVDKVRRTNLRLILGEEWISQHEKKVRQYAANYELSGWSKVLSSLPEKSAFPPNESPSEVAREGFRRFNVAFEEAYRKQTSWIVTDGKLRDEIKVSIAGKLVPAYRAFYDECLVMLSGEKNLEMLVRFAPDDLGNYLSDLFHGTAVSGSFSSSTSSRSRGNR